MPQFSEADPIVILSYARTPMGGMQGVFSDVSLFPPSTSRDGEQAKFPLALRADNSQLGATRDALLGLCNQEPERAADVVLDRLSRTVHSGETDVQDADRKSHGHKPDQARSQACCLARTLLLWSAYTQSDFNQGVAKRLMDGIASGLLDCSPQDDTFLTSIVEAWLEDPLWVDYLAGDAGGGKTRLHRFVEDNLSQKWSRIQRALTRNESPFAEEMVHLVGSRVGVPLSAALRPLPPLPAGLSRVFVVVDGAAKPSFWAVARKFLIGFEGTAVEPSFVPSLFQLGHSEPLWNRDCEWPTKIPVTKRPRTLGPIFERSDIDPDGTRFVLVFCGERCLDQDDWQHSPWAHKIVVCSHSTALPGELQYTTVDVASRGTTKALAAHLTQVVAPWLSSDDSDPNTTINPSPPLQMRSTSR